MALSNLDVAGIVSSQIASASAVLSNDELDLGVCLIDIGGGTTEIAVYTDGAIRHTEVFSLAGDSVTKDIAMSIRTPVQHAEDLKIRYACALTDMVQDDELINVPGVGGRQAQALNRTHFGGGCRITLPRTFQLGAKIRSKSPVLLESDLVQVLY